MCSALSHLLLKYTNLSKDLANLILTYACPFDVRMCSILGLTNALCLKINRGDRLDEDIFIQCAKYNQLGVLKLFHNLKIKGWSPKIAEKASEYGFLDLIKWLHYNHRFATSHAVELSVIGGHFETAKWLYSNNYYASWSSSELDKFDYLRKLAIKYNHLEIFKYLKFSDIGLSTKNILYSIKYGRLGFIKWLYKKEPIVNQKYMHKAAEFGNLNIMKFLFKNGHSIDSQTLIFASENMHWHIIDWVEKNHLWDDDNGHPIIPNGIIYNAFKFGKINFLKKIGFS